MNDVLQNATKEPNSLEEEINSVGWYIRQENNGWRPVTLMIRCQIKYYGCMIMSKWIQL
jgi:hypothetical protein